jgi:hypothetical protein
MWVSGEFEPSHAQLYPAIGTEKASQFHLTAETTASVHLASLPKTLYRSALKKKQMS